MKSYLHFNFEILENIIQLYGYFYVHVSGHRHNGLEKKNSSTSPGTMMHMMHLHFMFFAFFFKNLKSLFSEDNMPVHALNVFIENVTKMV